MTDSVTKALIEEVSRLREELKKTEIYQEIQALEKIVARRQQSANGSEVSDEHATTKLSPRPHTTPIAKVKSCVAAILEGVESPVPTRDLFASLESEGIHIAGDSPQNNLSAHLSRDKTFMSWGRSGWTLASSVTPEFDAMKMIATDYVEKLDTDTLDMLRAAIQDHAHDVPADTDRDLLKAARDFLGRNLLEDEKRVLRDELRSNVTSLSSDSL